MIDTSVWVDHFRKGVARLERLLVDDHVLCHPFVIGELACGNLRNRIEVIALLGQLAPAEPADDAEVLEFVERNRLYSSGLGWVDAHLLASTVLSGALLWTLDRRLQRALLQFFKPANWFEVRKALVQAGRTDLIGGGCDCLIPAKAPLEAMIQRRERAQREWEERTEGDHIRGEPGRKAPIESGPGYRPHRKTASRRPRSEPTD